MNVLDYIIEHGDDEGFEPMEPTPTDAQPGSKAKVEAMTQRLLRGEDLHHSEDRNYHLPMTSATRGVTARAKLGGGKRF
jgi:hypothetical protein